MRLSSQTLKVCLLLATLVDSALTASKPHVITFGRWTTVKVFAGSREDTPLEVKVRPLFVDGKLKEYTAGSAHEISDQVFAVRGIMRINDALPDETLPRWSWQRGGWLVINRGNGHASQATLPEFDPDSSIASWFRDYVAYCGVSEDGKKLFAVVMQLGRRKPVLRKSIGEAREVVSNGTECGVPTWQRQPVRVNFVSSEQKFTYAVGRHAVEMVDDGDEEAASD